MINHNLFFFHIISLLSGVGVISLGYVIYKQYQLDFMLSAVLYAKFMSIIVLDQALQLYMLANGIDLPFYSIIEILSKLSFLGMIYCLPKFVYEFMDLKNWKKVKRVLLITVLIAFIWVIYELLNDITLSYPLYIIFSICLVFCIIKVIRNKNKLSETLSAHIIRSYKILTFIFVISIIIDFLTPEHSIYPEAFFYLLFNIISIFWLLKLLEVIPNLFKLNSYKKDNDIKEFYRLNKVTERESEVSNLLIKGHSYEDISKELFVSKSTVKSHIRNLYRKLEINNKIELIAKINSF